MNNLYRQLNPVRQVPNNIKEMITKLKGIRNPQALVDQYIKENPQLNSLIQAANGNPEKAFRDFAKQYNIDADEIIKLLW